MNKIIKYSNYKDTALLCNYYDTLSGPLTYLMHFHKLHPKIPIIVIKEDPGDKSKYLSKLGIKYTEVSYKSKLEFKKYILLNYLGRYDLKYNYIPYSTKFLLTQSKNLIKPKVDILIHDSNWFSKSDRLKNNLFEPLHKESMINNLIFWRESIKSNWVDFLFNNDYMYPLYIKSLEYKPSLIKFNKVSNSISMNCRCNFDKSWRYAVELSKINKVKKCFYNFSLQVSEVEKNIELKCSYNNKVKVKYNYLPNEITKLLSKSIISVNLTNNEWNNRLSKNDSIEWGVLEAINARCIPIVNKFQHKILNNLGIYSYACDFNNLKELEKIIKNCFKFKDMREVCMITESNKYLLDQYLQSNKGIMGFKIE